MTDEDFERLFREYQAAVFGWIVRIVRDRAAAEDLTIETFWRVYNARARFDETRPFAPWVRRIATNCALNYLRSPFAGRRSPLEAVGERRTANGEPQFETREKIQTAFNSLPAKLRVAAMLALVEELPYNDIAVSLGISVNGVKSRVFRATRMLRKKLERMGITA